MRIKIALLLLSLSVGAWGQTFTHCQWTGMSGDMLHTGPAMNDYKCKEGIVHLFVDSESMDAPKVWTYMKISESDDVPAIQGTTTIPCPFTESSLVNSYGAECVKLGYKWNATSKACTKPAWSCADKTRTLLSSEDGKTHYCHKPQFTERK